MPIDRMPPSAAVNLPLIHLKIATFLVLYLLVGALLLSFLFTPVANVFAYLEPPWARVGLGAFLFVCALVVLKLRAFRAHFRAIQLAKAGHSAAVVRREQLRWRRGEMMHGTFLAAGGIYLAITPLLPPPYSLEPMTDLCSRIALLAFVAAPGLIASVYAAPRLDQETTSFVTATASELSAEDAAAAETQRRMDETARIGCAVPLTVLYVLAAWFTYRSVVAAYENPAAAQIDVQALAEGANGSSRWAKTEGTKTKEETLERDGTTFVLLRDADSDAAIVVLLATESPLKSTEGAAVVEGMSEPAPAHPVVDEFRAKAPEAKIPDSVLVEGARPTGWFWVALMMGGCFLGSSFIPYMLMFEDEEERAAGV